MRFSTELMSRKELKNLKLPSGSDEINRLLEKTKNHLNEKRLEILWNLVKTADTGFWLFRKLRSLFRRGKKFPPDIRPRFVVITKLQDPFNYYRLARYYNTFRDDLDYLYLYISSRCPMTDDDRKRSVESKLTLEREGRQIEAQEMVRFEAYQMATREQYESATLTDLMLDEIDVEKGTITKDQVEEFIRKRK